MKKRIIAFILSVVICIGLCACGVQTGTKTEDTNSKEDKNSETTSDTSDVTTGTSETESETTDEPVDATVSGTWTDMFCIINGHKVTFPCHWSDLEATGYVKCYDSEIYDFNTKPNSLNWNKTVWFNDEWRVCVDVYNVSNETVDMRESPNAYITGFVWKRDSHKSCGTFGDIGPYCEDIVFPGGVKTTFTAKDVEAIYGKPTEVYTEKVDPLITYYDEKTGVKLRITYNCYSTSGKYLENCMILGIEYKIDPEISGITAIEPVEEPINSTTD